MADCNVLAYSSADVLISSSFPDLTALLYASFALLIKSNCSSYWLLGLLVNIFHITHTGHTNS